MSVPSARSGQGEDWAFAALLSVGAYLVRSVIVLALNGVVIYALTVHGEALRPIG